MSDRVVWAVLLSVSMFSAACAPAAPSGQASQDELMAGNEAFCTLPPWLTLLADFQPVISSGATDATDRDASISQALDTLGRVRTKVAVMAAWPSAEVFAASVATALDDYRRALQDIRADHTPVGEDLYIAGARLRNLEGDWIRINADGCPGG